MSDELLFNKYEIFGIVQGQTDAVKKRIQSIPANTLLNASEQDLIQALVDEFRLNVPLIKTKTSIPRIRERPRLMLVAIPCA